MIVTIKHQRVALSGVMVYSLDAGNSTDFEIFKLDQAGAFQKPCLVVAEFRDWKCAFYFMHTGPDSRDPTFRAVMIEEACQFLGEMV